MLYGLIPIGGPRSSVRNTAELGLEAALEEIEKNKEVLYGLEATDACPRLFSEERFQFGG